MAATYSYLIEPSGIILDISYILADIIIDIAVNMQDPVGNPIFNGIYNNLPNDIKAIIDLIPTLGSAFIGPVLAQTIAGAVNVTEVLGKY